MQIIIDHFEENFAVCELSGGLTIQLPRLLFPNASDGDIFDITKNITETNKRKTQILNLAENLWEK